MRLALTLILLLCAPALRAQDMARPPAGLIRNDSGLPATLPLQVKSEAGLDHVVFLTAPDGAAPAMTGYIRGGEFFRLLVPPGDWRIGFASGSDWQGEDALFGPTTLYSEWPETLRFFAGESALHGHVLTLSTDGDTVEIAHIGPRTICRVAYWAPDLFDRPGDNVQANRTALPERMAPPERTDRLTQDDPSRLNPARPNHPFEDRMVDPLGPRHGSARLRSVLCE